MNDDELIQRLTRSLREQAEHLQPEPDRMAGPDDARRAPWAPEDQEAITAATSDGNGDRTAEYVLGWPTGSISAVGGSRRRWMAGGAAALAVAATVALAIVLPGRSHPISVPPAAATTVPAPLPAPTATTTPPTAVEGPVPATVPPAYVTTPTTAGPAVPAGFLPGSVTFVSADDGWVLGTTCSSAAATNAEACTVLAHTTDGGRTWSRLPAPSGATAVRFANGADGWAWTGGQSAPSALFQTSDGGRSWTEEPNPFAGSTIGDLEVSGGFVQLVAYGTCTAGSAGCQGQAVEELFSRSVEQGTWARSPYEPPIGAGPVLDPTIVVWGSTGWLINDNRVTVSGARLIGGVWQPWRPPCTDANGTATLAASSATDLAAVCQEGVWGPPDAGTKAGTAYLWTSTDGGSSFQDVGAVPVALGDNPVTEAPANPSTVIVGSNAGRIQASYDGGTSWTSGSSEVVGSVDFLGFTTATQAVALVAPARPALYITYNSGHTWTRVNF